MPTSNRKPSPLLAAQIAAAPRHHDDDHPLWQGPCAEGPLGGVTQSMLVRFMSCRERFRLKYVLGLEPHDRWNHRLGYGKMWHACEEVHAATRRDEYDRPDRSWRKALQDHCMEVAHGRPPSECEDIAKWMSVCNVQFPEYVKYWAEHPDVINRTPLMQEQVFDVPYSLPSGRVVRLRGKFDSVDLIDGECNCGADRTGPSAEAHDTTCPAASGVRTGIYLQENKTKGDIDRLQVERQLKFDLQTMLYLVALDTIQLYNGRALPSSDIVTEMRGNEVRGVRYNVVRRPLSGGKGSIRPHATKSTKTKVVPAETDEEFYDRLRRDYIAADPGYWFFRVRSEVSARDMQVFRETCLDPLLEQVCSWYDEIRGRSSQCYTPLNYRTPFGVYSALEEGGATEYDAYLETGSEAGLRRVEALFTELQ